MSAEARDSNPDLALIYTTVRETGVSNYRGARIPIPTPIRAHKWREHLFGYNDTTLADHLQFGFPLGFEGNDPPIPHGKNHASALRDALHIDAYIDKESALGALMGPFKAPPFTPWAHVNPLMTRPKKDTEKVRVITDLSMPAGHSINDFTPTDTWDSAPFKLTLATARSYADAIAAMGRGVWMSKVDLRRTYKQLPIDPLDYPSWVSSGVTGGTTTPGPNLGDAGGRPPAREPLRDWHIYADERQKPQCIHT